jgi:hypothetical protein
VSFQREKIISRWKDTKERKGKFMSEKPVEIKLPANLFQGKTAIITGASRGVGRATALRLAESARMLSSII